MIARRPFRLGAALLLLAGAAQAGPRPLPTPARVIYPGDKLTDAMLADVKDYAALPYDVVWDRADLIGKVARRTLLPGRPIVASAVETPRLVTMGTLVSVFYQQDGLSIVTQAQALQNGVAGQAVQARNLESGVVVTGTVQPDGSIRVQGG
jgi:flagella basal body P-ring formation protein FlgA